MATQSHHFALARTVHCGRLDCDLPRGNCQKTEFFPLPVEQAQTLRPDGPWGDLVSALLHRQGSTVAIYSPLFFGPDHPLDLRLASWRLFHPLVKFREDMYGIRHR